MDLRGRLIQDLDFAPWNPTEGIRRCKTSRRGEEDSYLL